VTTSLAWKEKVADAVSHALRVVEVGLRAVSAEDRVRNALRDNAVRRLADAADRIFVVTLGKASAAVLDGIRAELGGRVHRTATVGALGYPHPVADFVALGEHPFPGRRSARAARGLREFLAGCGLTGSDLVLVGVTGGTTAVLADPVPPLRHHDLRAVSARLLRSGMDVTEANRLRRVLSGLHAGGLLDHIGPARAAGLIVCDNVQVGDPGVGSGPTFPGPTGRVEAAEIAGRCLRGTGPGDAGLLERVLAAVSSAPAERGTAVPVTNVHVTGGHAAVEVMSRHAVAQGFEVLSLGARLDGPAAEVAAKVARLLTTRRTAPTLVVGGGEVTVEVRGTGAGGRCQELAWLVGRDLDGVPGVGFAAVASDGVDFLPHASGAWVDGGSARAAKLAGIDIDAALDANDTYPAHTVLGQILRYPPGRTNVCDLYVGAVVPEERR
jgi:glycerate 2-kinase